MGERESVITVLLKYDYVSAYRMTFRQIEGQIDWLTDLQMDGSIDWLANERAGSLNEKLIERRMERQCD